MNHEHGKTMHADPDLFNSTPCGMPLTWITASTAHALAVPRVGTAQGSRIRRSRTWIIRLTYTWLVTYWRHASKYITEHTNSCVISCVSRVPSNLAIATLCTARWMFSQPVYMYSLCSYGHVWLFSVPACQSWVPTSKSSDGCQDTSA